MEDANVTHLDVNALLDRVRRDSGGFFHACDIDVLSGHPDGRLYQVLVRAGGCRLTCATQDVAHLTACLEAGGDYVRDVSIIAR